VTDYFVFHLLAGLGDGARNSCQKSLGNGFADGAVTGVGVGVAQLNGDGTVNGLKGSPNGSGVVFNDTVALGRGVGVGVGLAGEYNSSPAVLP